MPFAKQNIDLKASNFPLLSSLRGRGVYVGRLDEDKEDRPKLYWAENVMPIAEGFASATYLNAITPASIAGLDPITNYPRTNMHIVYNSEGELTYLMENLNQLLLFRPVTGKWEKIAEVASTAIPYSVFFLKGTSYIFHNNMGLKKFGADFVLEDVVLKGTAEFDGGASGNVFAMTSVLSYLVAVTRFGVYWSDPIDETNFDPTNPITSLAGSSQVLSLKGAANMILPISNGFVIYTDTNAVIGTYSNNPNNPFVFKEIANSAGTFVPHHVSYKSSIPAHYAWTDAGFMEITPNGAASIFPEVTDFLGSDTLEFIELSTGEITKEVGRKLASKVTYINSRYIAISYGAEDDVYDYLLMFDTTLKRWGKLKIRHISVFNFLPPSVKGGMTYAEAFAIAYDELLTVKFVDLVPLLSESDFNVGSVGILDENFGVVKLEWLNNNFRGEGVLVFSGLSLTRNRVTDLNEVQLAGEQDPLTTKVFTRSNLYSEAWKLNTYVPSFDWYVGSTSGVSHELMVQGTFAIASIVVKLSYNGLE